MNIETFDGLETEYKNRLLSMFNRQGYVELVYLDDSNNQTFRPGFLQDHYYEVRYLEDKFGFREAHLTNKKAPLNLKFGMLKSLGRNSTGYDQPVFELEPERIIELRLLSEGSNHGEKDSDAVQVRCVLPQENDATTQFGYLSGVDMKPLSKKHRDINLYQCKDNEGNLGEPLEIVGTGISWIMPFYIRETIMQVK